MIWHHLIHHSSSRGSSPHSLQDTSSQTRSTPRGENRGGDMPENGWNFQVGSCGFGNKRKTKHTMLFFRKRKRSFRRKTTVTDQTTLPGPTYTCTNWTNRFGFWISPPSDNPDRSSCDNTAAVRRPPFGRTRHVWWMSWDRSGSWQQKSIEIRGITISWG